MNEALVNRRVDELILVYAADSGFAAGLLDSAKKLLHLNGCTLCALTHGLAGEKSEWRSCKEELGVQVTPYHRDDMPAPVAKVAAGKLPVILARSGDDLVTLLEADAIDRCRGSVEDLRGRLMFHLARHKLEISG